MIASTMANTYNRRSVYNGKYKYKRADFKFLEADCDGCDDNRSFYVCCLSRLPKGCGYPAYAYNRQASRADFFGFLLRKVIFILQVSGNISDGYWSSRLYPILRIILRLAYPLYLSNRRYSIRQVFSGGFCSH